MERQEGACESKNTELVGTGHGKEVGWGVSRRGVLK